MGGTAIFIAQGEAIDICDGVSFEHPVAFAGFVAPYDGVTVLNFGATIVMSALGGTAMRFNSITNVNLGGGANVTHHLYLQGASEAQGVYHTVFDDNILNICGTAPASITQDVQIINSNVYFAVFGNNNKPRGDRSALSDPLNKPFYINDNGTGTYGVWKFMPTPQNGWSQSGDGAWRKTDDDLLQWRGNFTAGTKTADTLICTMPEWARPAEDFMSGSVGINSGAVSGFKVRANGEIKVGPVAVNAADPALYMQDKQWTVIGQSSVAVGV
jgi:hypothetical protein